MRKIEVKPGYYEWNAYVDGELFYSFDGENLSEDALTYSAEDGTDLDDIKDITFKGLDNVAEIYVDAMQNEIQDSRYLNKGSAVNIDLTSKELAELKERLVMAWARHFRRLCE